MMGKLGKPPKYETETEEIQSFEAQLNAARAQIENEIKTGANWFYWIAGLSLINSLIIIFDGNMNFIAGLGLTQIFDAIGQEFKQDMGNTIIIITFILNLIVIGIFLLIGFFSNKKHLWAFIAGLVLYGIDGLILLYAMDIFSVLFHGIAIYFIFKGIKALNVFEKIEEKGYYPHP
jgi:hypothetical protein